MTSDEFLNDLTGGWNDEFVYVGLITQLAVRLERSPDHVCRALVGSKFAAVVSGGQDASWLIRYCRQLVKVHTELTDAARQALNGALERCSNAVSRRNDLVHSVIVAEPFGGPVQLVRSRRGTHERTFSSRTVDDIRAVVIALIEAEHDLSDAATRVLGEEVLRVGAQLRDEGPWMPNYR
jgi:hypothetical protein